MSAAFRFVAGLWAGALLCVALIATPAAFSALPQADAGRVAGVILAREAYASLFAAVVLLLLGRQASAAGTPARGIEIWLVLGGLFCTVLGHFGLQPMVAAARSGQVPWSFAVAHAASVAIFGVKTLLVAILAGRSSRPPRVLNRPGQAS